MLNLIIYGSAFLLCFIVVFFYIRKQKKTTLKTEAKIQQAKEDGLFEPISLHPVVDPNNCIKTGACISACPEQDILGIVHGRATVINASICIGHGACFHACPTEAISLCIGTEKRGVDLPHVNQTFETNVPGIYIAGELGGMGLIKNAVEQGKQATENLAKGIKKNVQADEDLIIIGAGPAGISSALMAKKLNIKALILEQNTLGGTVFTFPRSKIIMTAPMELPLYGKLKLYETSKTELLGLWQDIFEKHDIRIKEDHKVEQIEKEGEIFKLTTNHGNTFTSKSVLIAIGRRGSPRKLGIPGENSEKVAYRLLEPELIENKKIIVVGGGDSAVEAALSLADKNQVILSYRGNAFKRIKPKNREKLNTAIEAKNIEMIFESNLKEIHPDHVILQTSDNKMNKIENDMVYIFAGGELPTTFLANAGITITKKFGEAILKHEKK